MATYKGINGFAVQSVATDPSPSDEGQVWYNNATYAFKLAAVTTSGTWASGGNLNTARYGMGNAGTQTANIAFGGSTPTTLTAVENYNGTSWTSGTAMPVAAQYQGSSGTQTAALSSGGYRGASYNTNSTDEWNGSSWSAGGNLNTGRGGGGVGIVGLQTAGLLVAGQSAGGSAAVASESYNGTSWTNTPSLNTPRAFESAWGSNTAAIAVCGPGGTYGTAVESWNGSSWTTSTSYPVSSANGAGFGNSYTNGVNIDGETPGGRVATCSAWNGTSWTATGSLGTVRSNMGGSGNTSNGLCIGGNTGTANTAATEEFTGPGSPVTRTITTS
jgi:hypothetical protein